MAELAATRRRTVGGLVVAVLGAGAYELAGLMRGAPAIGAVHVLETRPPPTAVVVLGTDLLAPDVAHYATSHPVVAVFGRPPADEEAVRAIREGATAALVAGEFSRAELVAAVLDARRGLAHLSPSVATATVRAVRDPMRRRPAVSLSPRERVLLDSLATGASYAVIAARLGLAVQTIRNQVSVMYTRLGVHSRAEAAAWWLGGEHLNLTAPTAYRVRQSGPG